MQPVLINKEELVYPGTGMYLSILFTVSVTSKYPDKFFGLTPKK